MQTEIIIQGKKNQCKHPIDREVILNDSINYRCFHLSINMSCFDGSSRKELEESKQYFLLLTSGV